jgi:hypothetical protein
MCFLLATACILSIVIVATNESESKPIMFRIGLLCFLLQSLLFHVSQMYQYRRVINCVKEAYAQVQLDSFQRALEKLEYNQAAIAISFIPIMTLYVYHISTLEFYYWLIPITFSTDLLLFGSMIFKEMRLVCSKQERDEFSTKHTTATTSTVPLHLQLAQPAQPAQPPPHSMLKTQLSKQSMIDCEIMPMINDEQV